MQTKVCKKVQTLIFVHALEMRDAHADRRFSVMSQNACQMFVRSVRKLHLLHVVMQARCYELLSRVCKRLYVLMFVHVLHGGAGGASPPNPSLLVAQAKMRNPTKGVQEATCPVLHTDFVNGEGCTPRCFVIPA